ncbi:hypothetical protein Gogos_018201 [Gossypium gossypioides]|uniref:RNase H type-1 domain-containing protein n=1 Tax=Gossypium gossypioides TaxID=34282 RepID=A0A7J9BD53_GOSGO|nr:hypothetical protein [Gossypium gossypioides]
MIRDRAFTLSNDFRVHNLSHKPIIPFTPVCNNWKKEKKAFVKVNVDATLSNGKMGYGVIARDEEGFVVGGCGGYKNMEVISERVKLVALDEGMQLARRLKIQKFEMFVSADVMWTPRSNNRLDDFMCKFVLNNNCSWDFDVKYPREIHEIVIQDAINEM